MAGGRTAATLPATRRCPAPPEPPVTDLHLGPQSRDVTLVRLGETQDLDPKPVDLVVQLADVVSQRAAFR